MISRFDVPLELHTDHGWNLDSRLFLELSLLLGIKKIRTIPFHLQSNGIRATASNNYELFSQIHFWESTRLRSLNRLGFSSL